MCLVSIDVTPEESSEHVIIEDDGNVDDRYREDSE